MMPFTHDAAAALPGSRRLIVVVGPSGAGKDSLLGQWRASLPPGQAPHLVQRTITRPADAGGEPHEALTPAGFAAAARDGAFAFRWQAHGLHYGIRHEQLRPLALGGWVLMNGSRAHLPLLRLLAPQARVLSVDAPAPLRAARLNGRGREPAQALAGRLRRQPDVPSRVDLKIVNDRSLAEAVAQLDAWWRSLHTEALCA